MEQKMREMQRSMAQPEEHIAKPQTSSRPKGQSMEAQPTAGKGDGPKYKSRRRRLIGWVIKKLKKVNNRELQKMKIQILSKIKKFFLKPQKDPADGIPDTQSEIPVVLDFTQNLQQHHLAEADRQLLEQEVNLFISESDEPCAYSENDEDKLHTNYESLMLQLWLAIEDSFNKENQETLRSAMTAILQEEQRDRHWMELDEEQRPRWRPLRCRQIHDTLLKKVVELRLRQAGEDESGANDLSTSLNTKVCRMGKQIRRDLLIVVKDIQGCYSPEFNVCNMYAELYHQAFSTKLVELTRSNMNLEECAYILSWINTYYLGNVMQQKELESHINSESLGALLPEETLRSLEEQYLSCTEAELRKWLSKALKNEEERWQDDKTPELFDKYFISNLGLDVVHLVHETMKISRTTLGNEDKCQRILYQLNTFLVSYKKCISKLIKGKHKHVTDNVQANLVSIKQLREYIEERQSLSADKRAALLSMVADLRDSCHKYLLSPIHSGLKKQYKKLWTQVWLSGSHEVTGELIRNLEDKFQHFSNLKPSCREDLVSQLHFEVMTEYVRRMMKRKLKLKTRDEQEAAAQALCEDSERINTLFTDNGSREKWLSSVLLQLAEVLRLQETGTLELEIAMLVRAYPDLSERHILALLQLKTNLSSSDVRCIRGSLTANKEISKPEAVPQFFSKVQVQWCIVVQGASSF
ncbi:tumor necrosis factor alpha-induced protein 2-like isoform X1 [Brachyhypopomus gauderio]|uniref:tumor necrosis factor alpha-induced protein 2-like isoform X1 n=1 Tax=Brachyhypopomus gauderio TaxID=698409 RepID=UPI004042FC02